ncbi:MAG: 1,4-dihydroxy-2-naphthoate octaprenyltransferase [Bacteroidales bacterium]|jgi:1,4-dihydroxy-2-naphthoate octaprenyltransferase|nr:1,4-dihydroxy-2-naphthoate octaprenyltransferase [Bacteroidales bacterium]NLH24487.1 1,4-dihydroxy-2-naphthoate octaprenyltransferase [Bacteroidales bacterium]
MLPVLQSIRPRTLSLSVSSVLAGTILARAQGHFSWLVFLLLLSTACLLQSLSNLVNELGDWKKGTDKDQSGRKSLSLQSGRLTEQQLVFTMLVVATLSILSGLGLIRIAFGTLRDTIPMLFIVLGAIALLAAVFYSAGKRPYGYYGAGDLSVFLFFGLAGVAGSYYLITLSVDTGVLYIASAMGLLITAVLNVNNIRDFENDKRHGKNTFAVLLSRLTKSESTVPAKIYQMALISLAMILSAIYAFTSETGTFLFLISLPLLAIHLFMVIKREGASLDSALKMLILGVFVYALSLF